MRLALRSAISRLAAIFVVAGIATAALAQSAQVDGGFTFGDLTANYYQFHFSCSGTPTCAGVFNVTERDPGCSNTFAFQGTITLGGMDLSKAGSFNGSVSTSLDSSSNVNADGTCTYATHPQNALNSAFTGTWDGKGHGTFTFTFSGSGGGTTSVTGTFTSNAAAARVFPMTVTANVTPTTATANANIQPRPQDTGSTQSVYVFAHAPSNKVAGALAKFAGGSPPVEAIHDDAIVCVLAQVTADGRLVAVSPSTMTAYLTGVISSQGQAVQLLNSVSTTTIAGANLFVGYGPSASEMLSNGVYQSALSVPAAVQCTAALDSAPAPTTPAALSGLWWNAAESGWGIHFTQRGTNLFAAWYTYDTSGNPKWYVAPNCVFASADATSGSCTSALYEVNGPTFFGTPFNANAVHATQDGTLQLTFQDRNTASMTYTLPGFTRTVPIVRQVFPVAQSPTPAVDYTDLWWNPDESGWGMAITHQFGNIFLAWYVYDANGKPFWYVAPACTVEGSSCSGTLYRTTGPAFGPPLDPTKVQATSVGTAIVSFIDANNAVLSYTVNGTRGTKAIKRQLF